jgi:hypothetical protein
MEELTVPEILEGICNPAFVSQRLPLLELLTNKLGEPLHSELVVKDSSSSTETEKLENEATDTTSNAPLVPSTHSTILSEKELQVLFKTLLLIAEKTSCKSLVGRQIVNMALCALSNCTLSEAQALMFLKLTGSLKPDENTATTEVSTATQTQNRQLHFIIGKFLEYNPQLEENVESSEDWIGVDEWQQVGHLLTNLCQVDDGRRLLLKQSLGYMVLLVGQVSMNSSLGYDLVTYLIAR